MSVLPNAEEIRRVFNIPAFLHVSFVTKGMFIFLLIRIVPDTSVKYNTEMSDSLKSSKSPGSNYNKRLIKN